LYSGSLSKMYFESITAYRCAIEMVANNKKQVARIKNFFIV
jgi:hypothetical protein